MSQIVLNVVISVALLKTFISNPLPTPPARFYSLVPFADFSP